MMAPRFQTRAYQEPWSVRFVHKVASVFAAAEFELLVICLFLVVAYALKSALVSTFCCCRAVK